MSVNVRSKLAFREAGLSGGIMENEFLAIIYRSGVVKLREISYISQSL